MKIQIVNVNDVASDLAKSYLTQIATWHYQAWGSITHKQLSEFETSIYEHYKNQDTEYFVAIDMESHAVVGTMSLKNRNMEDEYPDQKWGPWLSGLYVREQDRYRGISAMLGKKLAECAGKKHIPRIYYFTHNQELSSFYNKLGGTQLKTVAGDNYCYRNKPILLYSADLANLVRVIDEYLVSSQINYDADLDVFTS